jgi:hypothetical protein
MVKQVSADLKALETFMCRFYECPKEQLWYQTHSRQHEEARHYEINLQLKKKKKKLQKA